MGQTKPVEIVRLVIKDSIEEEIYNMNKEEDIKNNLSLIIKEINDDTLILSTDKVKIISENIKKSNDTTKTTNIKVTKSS